MIRCAGDVSCFAGLALATTVSSMVAQYQKASLANQFEFPKHC